MIRSILFSPVPYILSFERSRYPSLLSLLRASAQGTAFRQARPAWLRPYQQVELCPRR